MSDEDQEIEMEGEDLEFVQQGQHFRTGLRLEPGGPKLRYSTFADRIGCLTKDQISKVLQAPGRVAGRVEFGPDWVLSQGQRSSCASYATAGMVEKAYKRRYGKRVKLGPEFLYSQVNGGRDSGSLLKDNIIKAMDPGIPPREFVKYESYRSRDMSPEAFANAKRFGIQKGEIYALHTDDEIASALALNWVVLVAVHVTNAWFKLDGDGVVTATRGPGNHAIHCDDIRINSRGEYEYDHAGSWATSYGDKGRGWVTFARHFRTTIGNHEFVAIRSVRDDPQAANQLPEPKL